MKPYKSLSKVLQRCFASRSVMSGMSLFEPTKLAVTSTISPIPKGQSEEIVEFQLERHEIEARLYNVVHKFKKIDMKTFKPTMTFEQLNLDSLETIAVIVAVETEFHTVFEENVFDNFETPQDIINYLTTSPYAF